MKTWSAIVLLVLVGMFSGCGSGPDENGYFTVSGRVLIDGQPLDRGLIVFRSTDDLTQNVASKVENGTFTVNIQSGTKRVEISAEREVSGQYTLGASGEKVPARESYIPAKFNTKSELETVIAYPPKDDLIFDLDLS